MELTLQQQQLIKNGVTLLTGALQQIPDEVALEILAQFKAGLDAVDLTQKPTPEELINAGVSLLNEVAGQSGNEKFIEAAVILKDIVEAFESNGHPIIAFFKGMIQGKRLAKGQ
ncbi:MAG TPA: hypothetical protein VG603_13880 [Chitinophagales bacterium]|nr:hypothetical protein [Chitinophagales bacterium]